MLRDHPNQRDSVGRILPNPRPLQNGNDTFPVKNQCQHAGVRRRQNAEIRPRVRIFVESETWYNKKKWLKKIPLGFPFCRECRVRSDPCLGFCRASPPLFKKYLRNPSPQGDHFYWREGVKFLNGVFLVVCISW